MTKSANERRSLIARAQRRADQGGAAMVEYSLLLFAVLICAAAAIKTVGPAVACAGENATDSLIGGMSGGGCGGATASAGGGGGSDGATAGSSGGGSAGTGGGAGEGSSGGGGGGEVASSGGDDGTGGFQGGSGSNSGSGSSGAASGSGSSGSAGGGGGGSVASSSSDGSGTNGAPTFGSQAAGTSPKAIDLTLAKLSEDTYNKDKNGNDAPKGADGFKPLSASDPALAKAGITPNMLSDKNSGFLAVVYTDGKGNYVVAYRGTDNFAGWKTDAAQATGHKTAQYSEALRLAQAMKATYGNNVIVTGHSLGGGEAAAVAAATGLTGVTFNAAGVNDKTLTDENVNPATARAQANNGQVRRYEVQGDLLTGTQEAAPFLAQPLGRGIAIQDPHPYVSAADRGFSPVSGLLRAKQLHSEYTEGMEKAPVIYQGADGKAQTYQFSNPNNPS